MAVAYDSLPDVWQELIDDVKVLIGDIDPDEEDQMFTVNQWATILQATIRDFNRARPHTDFVIESFPANFVGLLEIGMLYFGSLSRSNHLLEDLPIQGYQGPNVDTSVLHQRWASRAQDIWPLWRDSRNKAKMLFLPKPVGTVNLYGNYWGQSASVIPALRALPSWNYARN